MLHGGEKKLDDLRDLKGEVSLRELFRDEGNACFLHSRGIG
jgi:hypothetical protein